mgnify:CR=1 FL=1
MDTAINNLLKTDDGKPNESNKDNLSSKAPGSLNTITCLAKRFRSVFVVLYYINIVLIISFVIFLTIGIISSRSTPDALILLVLSTLFALKAISGLSESITRVLLLN